MAEKLTFATLLERIETQLGFEYHDHERVEYELENMTVKRLLEMLAYLDDEDQT